MANADNKLHLSNEDISIRLFDSNFLEFFTYFHFSTPLVVFVPVISYYLYQALYTSHISSLILLSGILGGLVLWSFAEYMTHRFLFHAHAASGKGKRFVFLFHGVHHDYPRDSWRLIMTPFASIPVAIVSFYVFHWVFSAEYAIPAFIGFVSGYVVYDMLHYMLHHGSNRFPIFKFLKKYHLRHHYSQPDRGFGVTTPFWDYVFHTQFKK